MDEPIRWFPLDRIGDLEAEIAAGLAARSWCLRRDAIAVALGLHGLRVGEVCNLQPDDFRPATRRLFVRTLKKGRARLVTLHGSVVQAIQWWAPARAIGSAWLLFSRSGNRLDPKRAQAQARRWFDRILGPGHRLTFHSLRHTFGMRLYAETGDVMLCKRELGHASVSSTEVYVRALAEVPEACLVRLDRPGIAPSGTSLGGCQLRLFHPSVG